MLAVKSVDVKNNFEELGNKVSMGETVLVSQPRNGNIYMISEEEYNAFKKAKENMEYLAMLKQSDEELKAGKVVVKTMEELEKQKYPNLKERLEAYYKKPIDEIFVESMQEVNTGTPIGDEIW